jgi:diaminohydroxyphosphoribosylaminopyrimidine deaminase/5-amino-6-(5-phosphoribosylamino)uracil reductase
MQQEFSKSIRLMEKMTDIDIARHWMQQAIACSKENLIKTSPNPKVGCVIVNAQGELIGKGSSDQAGGKHAEINAIEMAKKNGGCLGAKLYVTLEPCSHYGRTPPCVLKIIEEGITEVWVGTIDPNPLVAGKGIKILQDHGIQVQYIEKEACDHLHRAFMKWIIQKRPWVSLKVASSLDGALASHTGDSKWITNEISRTRGHQLRAQADAILIGGQTARQDHPKLDVRLVKGLDPIPVILSKNLSLPEDLPCLKKGTILAHAPMLDENHKNKFKAIGCELIELPYQENQALLCLDTLLIELGKREICHLLVEGGGKIHGQFIAQGLADELYLFFAPKLIGNGLPSFDFNSVDTIQSAIKLKNIAYEQLGHDLLVYGKF